MLYNIDINKMNKLMSNNEDARQIIPQLLRNHRNTISTISHEIRNPLTLVSSALQVMEKQNPELKDIPHWSQVMGDVDFIIQLLEELSAFNSSNELYYSVFSIEQLLKTLQSLLQSRWTQMKQILNFPLLSPTLSVNLPETRSNCRNLS